MSKEVTAPLPIGSKIGDKGKSDSREYKITQYLGRGGFGITYMAEATVLDRNIPVKGIYTIKEFCLSDVCTRNDDGSLNIPSKDRSDYDSAMIDFKNEAERLEGMTHDGIVPVNEVFHANGTVYYVMQYLGDTTLQQYVEQRGGQLSEREACDIAKAVAAALEYLHRQRVTHLDVKPDNIMMTGDDNGQLKPVLIDFGLACHYKGNGSQTSRHNATGVSEGYSPLEQYGGITKFSPESDVYALTATLYFMLTGKAPVKAADMDVAAVERGISGLKLSSATQQTLKMGLQKIAEQRTQNIGQFLTLLEGEKMGGTLTERDTPGKKGIDMRYVAAVMTIIAVCAVVWALFAGRGGTVDINESQQTVQQTQVQQTQVQQTQEQQTQQTQQSQQTQQTQQQTQQTQQQTQQTQQSQQTLQTQQTQHHQQSQQQPSSGTRDLGYATYTGKLKNGVPDGQGTMTFKQSKRYDTYQFQAGDMFVGEFTDGRPESGTWIKSNGTSEQIIVGGI